MYRIQMEKPNLDAVEIKSSQTFDKSFLKGLITFVESFLKKSEIQLCVIQEKWNR